MSSIIAADSRGKCLSCGGTDFKNEIFDLKLKLAIAKCSSCGNYPDKIRVRRSLPIGDDGEASRVDIRFNKLGERIGDIEEAKHIARSIDYDIKGGRFDPNDYRPKGKKSDFIFNAFIEKKYYPIQEKKLLRKEISEGGLKAKRSSLTHLKKYFALQDIRRMKGGMIEEYYQMFSGGPRARDLSIIELKVILGLAFRLGLIQEMPHLPKIKKAKMRDVEKFLNQNEQDLILSKVHNPTYKAMIEILTIYAMRPCEIRALQWGDLDFKDDIITINRHFSDGVHLMEGRKSNEHKHYLPMTERFKEIISQMPRSIVKTEYVFKGKEGGAVGDRVLARHWALACKEAKITNVQLYEGTKHSRLSRLKKEGYSNSDLLMVSGHTNETTLKRYAQLDRQSKLEIVRSMIE